MKKNIIILTVLIAMTIKANAQTAADYYLPLCVGNYLKFNTPNGGGGGGWEARTTFYSIVHSDSINGEVFYLQKGYEVMNFNPIDTNVFHYFWLRKDANGEILIGAYDLTGNGTLDSAIIAPPGAIFFSNQFLTLGFSQTQSGGNVSYTDSVISISATVGTYTNCIQKRNTRKTNGIIDMMEDTYYAYHVGIVKQERFVPATQIHVASIVDFVVANCYLTGISDGFENENEFSIYPNPFSSTTTLQTEKYFKDAILTVYNSLGQLVKQIKNISGQTVILSRDNLPRGQYFVRLTQDNSQIETKKLIITD